MIWTIAWRNVWRNKKRSAIIISAIIFGLWAGIISVGITLGMMQQMVDSAIASSLSHIQIHQPGFLEHKEISLTIAEGSTVLQEAEAFSGIKAASGRAVISGMASTTQSAAGVEIYGIIPEKEKAVTCISQKIQTGTYFDSDKRNPLVIGRKLADRLEVKIGSKVVLTAQARDSTISAGAFRIVGIYKTESSVFDEISVFAEQQDVDKIFGLEGQIHEIAVLVENSDEVDSVSVKLSALLPQLQVQSWKQLSKILASYVEMGIQMLDIFMILILLTLIFGITNTLLMGVVERMRELGVVLALGMNHRKVFSLVLLESVMLSLVGGVIGVILGIISIEIIAKYGIDLALFSEGLAEFGISQVTYPYLPVSQYPKIILMVVATAVIAAVFPGIKALRLNPIQAIRTY